MGDGRAGKRRIIPIVGGRITGPEFTGEILSISHEDVVYVITVLIGQQVVKVIAEENTVADLSIGDKVLVTSKAFNPIIQKVI